MDSADFKHHARAEHPTLSTQFLEGVQQMDPASWSRLVTTFAPITYRWCRASGVPSADVPDLVQEVFAAVARGIGSFEREKAEGSFRSWLATITRNKVRDFFRQQQCVEPAVGGTQALEKYHQLVEQLDSTICSANLQDALVGEMLQQVEAEFESKTWQAFWMTCVDDVQAAAAAQRLGMSVASVYQAKSRVLRRLRIRLAEFS